jgi:hypothetical protein
VFKLRRVRVFHIDKWSVRLHDSVVQEISHLPQLAMFFKEVEFLMTYSKVITFHSKTLKVSTTENYRPEIGVYGFQERFGRGKV